MQDGQRPTTVGFFFALGHSAVILIVAAAVAATAAALQSRFESWKEVGKVGRYDELDAALGPTAPS